MIEFVTKGGVSLDLDPEAEFELEIGNPLLEDDRIPVPFSTSIAFLPTPTNKSVFRYLDAMMLRPEVKEVPVTFLASGIPVETGTLVYDSVDEDGRLNYTFQGVDYTERWKGYIYELKDLVQYSSLRDVQDGLVDGVRLPQMVASGLQGKNRYEVDSSDHLHDTGKLLNAPIETRFPDYTNVIPVVSLILIAERILGADTLQPIAPALKDLYMVAPYRNADTIGQAAPPIEDFLPALTCADFIAELCKLTGASLFKDGTSLRIVASKTILSSADFLDWDGKVSDRFHQSVETAKGYEFGFDNNEGTDNKSLGDDIKDCSSLLNILDMAEYDYQAVRYTRTGEVFSVKLDVIYKRFFDYLADLVLDPAGNIESSSEDTFSAKLRFKKVRSVPRQDSNTRLRMVPIVSVPAIGADRGTDSYIGIVINNQMCDKGVVFTSEGSVEEVVTGKDLSPAVLFGAHHKDLAAWFGKDRQAITADVDLDVSDIAAFRMWQKVLVRHRPFLVRKLNIRFLAASDIVTTTAELIAL